MIIYHELNTYFERFNQMFEECLGNRLSLDDIIFTLQRKSNVLGYFAHKKFESQDGCFKHEIALNPEYFTVKPKIEILRVFCQELLQIYRIEYGDQESLKIGFYDDEWGAFMMCVGLMPSHNGKPDGKETGKKMSSYILPDGEFIKLCNQLAEEGLLIEWFDKIPAKYEIDHLMKDLYEIRDLIDLDNVHPSLIEVPILKRRNINVFNFLECLERNEHSKKIELNSEKAIESNIISPQPETHDDAKQPLSHLVHLLETESLTDLRDKMKNDTHGYESDEDYVSPNVFDKLLDRGIVDYDLDDDLDDVHDHNQVDLVDVINKQQPIDTKEKLAEIIGIEKPKPPATRKSFKYKCGCDNEVVANKEHLRFTCNSCQMAYRCETENYEVGVAKD